MNETFALSVRATISLGNRGFEPGLLQGGELRSLTEALLKLRLWKDLRTTFHRLRDVRHLASPAGSWSWQESRHLRARHTSTATRHREGEFLGVGYTMAP